MSQQRYTVDPLCGGGCLLVHEPSGRCVEFSSLPMALLVGQVAELIDLTGQANEQALLQFFARNSWDARRKSELQDAGLLE